MRRTQALIAGGGPAGAAAAIRLATGGLRPVVLERSRDDQDTVCGGFLGWDALTTLGRLGIDVTALGARPITRLRLVVGDHVVEAALPHLAAGLSRRKLDAALLAAAGRAGAGVERGITIRQASPSNHLVLADGTQMVADALFLATGKHDLRGLPRPRDAAGGDPAIGLRTRLAPDRALDGVIELHLFDHGYAGFLAQEDGVNFCLSVARSRLTGCGGTPEKLIASLGRETPRLADRFTGANGWQAVASVPYGWRARQTEAGLYRLGDQAAVIASVAGDGVAIALSSGMAAADAHIAGGPEAAVAYQSRFAAAARRPLAVAGAVRRMGETSYGGPMLAALAHVPGLAAMVARVTRIGA